LEKERPHCLSGWGEARQASMGKDEGPPDGGSAMAPQHEPAELEIGLDSEPANEGHAETRAKLPFERGDAGELEDDRNAGKVPIEDRARRGPSRKREKWQAFWLEPSGVHEDELVVAQEFAAFEGARSDCEIDLPRIERRKERLLPALEEA
jgi:hypothetical protein